MTKADPTSTDQTFEPPRSDRAKSSGLHEGPVITMRHRDSPGDDPIPASSHADGPGPGPTRASAAFGLWMLLAGVPTTASLARQGNGTFALAPAGATLIGALLLLEARRAGAGPPPATDSPVEVTPGMVARPAPSDSRRQSMPIWLHLILGAAVSVVGFFGGAIVGAGTFGMIVRAATAVVGPGQPAGRTGEVARGLFPLAVAAPCFFGGAVLGLSQSHRLFSRNVPARCPRCGGGAYYRAGSPITYRCQGCGHVHATMWHVKGYRGRR
jgi:hypothetical protein